MMPQWSWPLDIRCHYLIILPYWDIFVKFCSYYELLSYGHKTCFVRLQWLWPLTWPPDSNQFILASTLTFVPNIIKFPPGVLLLLKKTRAGQSALTSCRLTYVNINKLRMTSNCGHCGQFGEGTMISYQNQACANSKRLQQQFIQLFLNLLSICVE